MSKINEFLTELEQELCYLKPKDASEVLKFYRDKINIASDYEENEEKIIATLPSPKKIAEDIYKSKGKDYLNTRKKQVKRDNKIKGILSLVLVILVVLVFLSISLFVVTNLIQLFKLIGLSFKMESIVDIITLDLFSLLYILTILIVYMYIFDLMYIIASHFLYNFLYEYVNKDKEYKALSFTISGLFEKIFNKKVTLGKVLLIVFASFIVLGISNYATQGYIYRSINDGVSYKESVVINDEIKEIKINNSTTFVKVFQGTDENIQIRYSNEFNDKLSYKIENGILIIDSIKSRSFDLFGLLDEPLSIVEIILPASNQINKIDTTLTDGYFDIVEYSGNITLDIKGLNSTYAITRSKLDSLIVNGQNLNIASEENNIKNVNLKLESGKAYLVKDTYEELMIENHLADLVVTESNINIINISSVSARSVLDNIVSNEITFKDQNSESLLQYVDVQNAKIISYGSSSIDVERSIIRDTLSLENASGNIDLTLVKANNISTELRNGTVKMISVNKNVSNEENEFLKKYNATNLNSNLILNTYKTNVEITSSLFNEVDCDFKEGKISINSSYLKNTDMYFMDTTINLIDVDGIHMDVDVDGGIFSFDDETITTDIVVCVTGELIKTDIYISERITRGEGCEE